MKTETTLATAMSQVRQHLTKTVFTDVERTIRILLASVRAQNRCYDLMDETRRLLDSLPLGTEEHNLSCICLNNARRYWQSNETGAARYELRLLKGLLDSFGQRNGLSR